jgi:hypothetical protein
MTYAMSNEAVIESATSDPQEWTEWDDYEEAGPMDLEDQLDGAMEKLP